MQSPYPEYSTSATPAATGEQAIEMDKTAYNNGTLDMPDNPDAEMLALSANLFSYIENASSANGGGAAGSASQLDHNNNEQNSNAGASTLRPSSQPSAAGPLRHRRGQQDRQLSINSFASNNSNSDSGGGRPAPESNESNDVKTTTSSEHRTVKVGEHAFTIPLSAPIIPPQLQANVRMTSTGRPSHARKVPDDHVKRPRNAFILFRSYACTNKLLPPSLGITDHRQVSRIVGQLWKGLKPEEKAIWEKLAHEEKERHKLMNPNYRYRPTYRKEVPSKRRRKKAVDEEEIEEEDRQCEVVARVLLEGREVDTDELEREVEEQKIKDQLEGRQRTSRSRSRSRSNSKLSDGFNNNNNSNNLHTDAQGFFLGMGGRPSSAPPQGADPFEGNANVPAIDHHFNGMSSRGKRSRTIGTSGPDFMQGQYSSLPQHQHPNVHPQVSHQRYMSESVGHNAPPSLRNASNLQHLFNNNEPSSASSEPAHSGNGYSQFPPVSQSPFLSSFSGFKGGNGDVSLLSPSFSRKFSLGRWEVPHHHHATGANFGSGHPFTGQQGSENPVVAASTLHQHSAPANGTVSSATSSLGSQEQTNYSTVAQPTSDQAFDPAAVPPGYNFVPTYVYLSKEDAQNPQIVEHYLAQGFGVSYDA